LKTNCSLFEMKKFISVIPTFIKLPLRIGKKIVYLFMYYGKNRWCPVCGKPSRKFLEFGINPRENALCPHCNSLERHRFVWLYFKKKTNLFKDSHKKLLHIAPEKCLEKKFRKLLKRRYLTADLSGSGAMIKMDITNIDYPAESFDVIYCSHVLEHVPDDKKALREFYRVLKSDGFAILIVPLSAGKTFEDLTIRDANERLKKFGHEDHVRSYGPDFIERLKEAGFKVSYTQVSDLFDNKDAEYMGLKGTGMASGDIYHCKKE